MPPFGGYQRSCGRSRLRVKKERRGKEKKKRCKRWEVSKFVMRLAGLLLAHKQTRTSVMSVAGAAGRGSGGHVANLNRAKALTSAVLSVGLRLRLNRRGRMTIAFYFCLFAKIIFAQKNIRINCSRELQRRIFVVYILAIICASSS